MSMTFDLKGSLVYEISGRLGIITCLGWEDALISSFLRFYEEFEYPVMKYYTFLCLRV